MIGMGLLDPAAGWQDRHRVTNRAKEVMTLVAAELSETGKLSWRKGTLARLLDSLSEASQETNLGWCARPEIDALLEVERSAHPEPAEGEIEVNGNSALDDRAFAVAHCGPSSRPLALLLLAVSVLVK